LWKVMFLSKGIMSFKGVRRAIDIKFLQTGKRMNATSTCSTKAAERAIGNVNPNWFREPIELSCEASAKVRQRYNSSIVPSAHSSTCRT
jgi:hypothetical protein